MGVSRPNLGFSVLYSGSGNTVVPSPQLKIANATRKCVTYVLSLYSLAEQTLMRYITWSCSEVGKFKAVTK